MTSRQSSPPASPFWDRQRHQDRRPFLLARARIKRALRQWFETQNFIEVDCGCLQISPGNETHLHAFATSFNSDDGAEQPLYLHTSPEFACKKLLAAGEARIFTFAPVFRNRDRGALHHPEFTMLEWYRARASYTELMQDCAQLIGVAGAAANSKTLTYRDALADAFAPPQRITVAQAFMRFAGINLFDAINPCAGKRDGRERGGVERGSAGSARELADSHRGSADGDRGSAARDILASAARSQDIRVADDDTWSDIFSRILTQRVEPHLGRGQPSLLCDYPLSEAALARPSPQDPRLAERFELYACGVELANGFGELTDAAVQRQRFASQMRDKKRIYGESYPIDEDFLAALQHMPEASGCALGFDRLVMLACGAPHIEAVIWTPLPLPD